MSVNRALFGPVSFDILIIFLFQPWCHGIICYAVQQSYYCNLSCSWYACEMMQYFGGVHATSWKIGRWAWIYSWMYLFQLIFGSSSYFKHGNMPIRHTQYVECKGSVCRLPQGIWTDVSEYEQDTSSIIGRWTWINSWMDLFYVIFGSSSYFDNRDHDHVIPYIINQKTAGTLW